MMCSLNRDHEPRTITEPQLAAHRVQQRVCPIAPAIGRCDHYVRERGILKEKKKFDLLFCTYQKC